MVLARRAQPGASRDIVFGWCAGRWRTGFDRFGGRGVSQTQNHNRAASRPDADHTIRCLFTVTQPDLLGGRTDSDRIVPAVGCGLVACPDTGICLDHRETVHFARRKPNAAAVQSRICEICSKNAQMGLESVHSSAVHVATRLVPLSRAG